MEEPFGEEVQRIRMLGGSGWKKQQSIAAFDDLKDQTGKAFPPVVLIEKMEKQAGSVGAYWRAGRTTSGRDLLTEFLINYLLM